MAASLARRAAGTGTIPVLGSMVQNGKVSAAMDDCVNALNNVDLPTFGRPTIPQLKPMKPLTNVLFKKLLLILHESHDKVRSWLE